MTERQGGSDVRANTTAAQPVNGGGPGGEYRLTGYNGLRGRMLVELAGTMKVEFRPEEKGTPGRGGR